MVNEGYTFERYKDDKKREEEKIKKTHINSRNRSSTIYIDFSALLLMMSYDVRFFEKALILWLLFVMAMMLKCFLFSKMFSSNKYI